MDRMMDRRDFARSTIDTALVAAGAPLRRFVRALDAQPAPTAAATSAGPQIAMLLYPGFTPLDLVGPHYSLQFIPDAQIHFVSRTRAPVVSEGGLPITPTAAYSDIAAAPDILFVPGAGHVFQGLLPPVLDYALTALVWLWFVNLYNFMDGIDGITGGQTAAIGFGVALVGFLSLDPNGGSLPLGLALGATALGFLAWNWAPAKLFLGDVGSIPLGYLTGWLLLGMAGEGRWAPALILPLYYLVDATVTLLRRAARFEKIWHAHREHFYQRAVQAGLGHAAVVLRILAANVVLIGLAVLGLEWPWVAAVLAFLVVGGLLWELTRRNSLVAPQV